MARIRRLAAATAATACALAACGGTAAKHGSPGTASATRVPRAGRIPPPLSPVDIYAADRPGLLSRSVRHDPALVYVPNSKSDTVDVISQRTFRTSSTFPSARCRSTSSRRGTCARCT